MTDDRRIDFDWEWAELDINVHRVIVVHRRQAELVALLKENLEALRATVQRIPTTMVYS